MGKAKNLRNRVSSYFQPVERLLPKTQNLVSDISSLSHIVVESEIDALILEANLIKKFWPHYNIAGKDDRRFPYIEISHKDKIPLVKITRQASDPQKLYFGPYPTGSNIFNLLRFLRRIFPFVSQTHHDNKACLRSHLGLCPCQNLSDYPQNLKKLIAFLSGKRRTVQKQLASEMANYAKNEQFEKAGDIKQKLVQIDWITAPTHASWEYETNPNLIADRHHQETQELQKILDIKNITKIECYDISHTGGRNTTGAQVTFVNSEPEKSLYRRYKIKLNPPTGGPDDYAFLQEMLSRRLKSSVPLPDLFVIDGGAGQLSVLSLPKPTIALAKRLETIYYQNQTIQLPPDSAALHLLQRLRDESHRFSRKYHFLLRSKKMLELV